MVDTETNDAYTQMWEDFAHEKGEVYNEWKFTLINRVGLTNYIREEAILQCAIPLQSKRVLDVGCASGRQVFRLAEHCGQVTGVDIAPHFIEECQKQKRLRKADNTDFAVSGFDTLPDDFDLVICCEVLEHVIDLDASIDALHGAVKPGGHLLITVPHYNADGTWWGRLLRLVGVRSFTPIDTFSVEAIKEHGDAHVREFSRKDLASHFIQRGDTVKKLYTVSHLDGPWGDTIITGFLYRMPWTRRFFVGLERVLQKVFTGLVRHNVLLVKTAHSSENYM